MRSSSALLALAVAAVSAQVQDYDSSLDMEIDPNIVDPSERSNWCRAQSNTCDNLCDADASTNDCNFDDLSYECTCGSNDSAPGLQWYTQTMPTFICDELFKICIEQNVGSQDGQESCEKNIGDLCAKTNPPTADDDDSDDEEESTSSSTATATSPPSESTAASEDNVSTTDSDGLAAPTAAPRAIGALAAIGLVAAFI